MTYNDWSLLAQFVTAAGVVAAAIQIIINRKQLFLGTIARCIESFRKIELELSSHPTAEPIIKNYVDLVAEELFYFQNGYIPKVVALEWIDGMIDYLPLLDKNGKVLNIGHGNEQLAAKKDVLLKNYPRIKHAFTISIFYDIELAYSQANNLLLQRTLQRKKIVEEIYNNIQTFSF